MDNSAPSASQPRHHKARQLVKQLSQDSLKSPMAPEHVVVEAKNEETGEVVKKKVYVNEINGTRTLDLYSGWNPDTGQHKLPLKTLPAKVCGLVTLERLWVSHNKLASLPPQIDQMIFLRELFLHRNCLEDIPQAVCNLPKLEILWLNSNKITVIPNEIAKLRTLKRLHLDCNFIEEFPDSLCDLITLEVLYLNNNSLQNISEKVCALKHLRRLYLQHNKITDLPSGISQLTKIEMLFLDHNEIRHVKRDFEQFQRMRQQAGKTVSTTHNPFVTPQSKLKLSVGHPRKYSLPMKARRHSDQYACLDAHQPPVPGEMATIMVPQRPIRSSLPESDLPEQFEKIPMHKADTLPRLHPRKHILD